MSKLLTGPFAVLMTPFVGDKVDEQAFIAQIKMANDSGISGFVTNGSTAEYVHLSLEEQMRITEITAKEKAPNKKLIVSACTSNLADTVKLCRHAGTVHADAVLVCPPYYFKYPESEREAYYKSVADHSPVPVLLYSVPFFTQEIELDLVLRLFEHPNIIGIKDSSANMKRLMHMAQYTDGKDISVMTGTDDILISALVGGCAGSLTDREIDMLPMGAKVITLEQGIRFLTDYLQGDTYYKTTRPGQNLDRTRTQLKMVADMEQKWDVLQEIVKNC